MSDVAEGYELNAHDYLRVRDKSSIGTQAVNHWCQTLNEGATVIELACGGGYPITQALSHHALQLWAVDSSPTLVKTFQSRFPNIPVQCAKVQEFDYFNRSFDAAIAIGILFLLSESDQIDLISTVSGRLNPGGRFLFTAPTQIASWQDITTGTESRSLGQEKYLEILSDNGFSVLSSFTDEGENNYYDAERV